MSPVELTLVLRLEDTPDDMEQWIDSVVSDEFAVVDYTWEEV